MMTTSNAHLELVQPKKEGFVIGMGLLRTVEDGVREDTWKLNGVLAGMERHACQEARLIVVEGIMEYFETETTWQKHQMAFKRLRIGKSQRAPEPKK